MTATATLSNWQFRKDMGRHVKNSENPFTRHHGEPSVLTNSIVACVNICNENSERAVLEPIHLVDCGMDDNLWTKCIQLQHLEPHPIPNKKPSTAQALPWNLLLCWSSCSRHILMKQVRTQLRHATGRTWRRAPSKIQKNGATDSRTQRQECTRSDPISVHPQHGI